MCLLYSNLHVGQIELDFSPNSKINFPKDLSYLVSPLKNEKFISFESSQYLSTILCISFSEISSSLSSFKFSIFLFF